jgi:putative two-component system response regulator
MPVMDGLEFVQNIRKKRSKKDLSIIVLTSDTNSYTTSKFLKDGANDYITKPFSRDEFYARVYHNIEAVSLFEDMQNNFDDDIINLLSDVTEFKSSETGSHVKRISEYSYLLARLSGIYEDEARLIGKLSTLHDIGKVSISDHILCKPAKLTVDEFERMKQHTVNGAKLLDKAFKSDAQVAKIAKEISLYHHEKYDGSGYPEELNGEKIPIHARIVALVDVFDALINKRVYKSSWKLEEVLAYIEENSSKAFDPKLVKLFLANIDCFMNVLHKHGVDEGKDGYCKINVA